MKSIQNKKYLVLVAISVLTVSLLLLGINQDSFAHRSGCHRWHSCPSDSGSYECGDLGYDNYCPKKQKDTPSSSSGSSSPSYPSSTTKPTVSSKLPECKGTKLCILGTVNRIIDGDTLTVDTYTIRLSLTNTPEKNEAGFKEATSFTSKRCPVGSSVIVDQDDGQPTDKYKRTVAKVICSGNILNSDLLYYGHAKILTQYCKKSEFSSESWAKRFGC